MARVEITGSQQRHLFYFPVAGAQTQVRVPEGPAGVGIDPAGQLQIGLQIELLTGDNNASGDEPFTLSGPNLWNQPLWLTGYSRFQP